jgi:YfiH family protein
LDSADIKIYEFEDLKKCTDIIHGIFTRHGGTSTKSFDSLNVGMNSGDKKTIITDNRKLLIEKMGLKPLVFLNQVHGSAIKVLKQDYNDLLDMFEPGKDTYTADGIITDMKNIFLVIQVADCQAVMLYDPEKKVIANLHSGWRGSINNIIGNCIDKMVESFGCRPGNMIAGISPSIGPCCSEFINYKDEISQDLWKYKINDKDYFDFWGMSSDQLMDKGLKKENVENLKICTKCNTNEFYSYRAEKTTGRFACVISMI